MFPIYELNLYSDRYFRYIELLIKFNDMCALYEPYMGPMSAVYEPYMGPI